MRNDPILKMFAQNVKSLRSKKGWTQEELARRAELHRTYIGSIERHERNVTLLNVASIAKALGVKARELI
ncbi:MAG TPA: helix-turn-helix transcriptional regulator [Sedimentisphaerales bacterium]|nr:helix-turn-helix transcriptional regulator [Sedimentisphaerales bacterium]